MFDRDYARVDLYELRDIVEHANEICHRSAMELVEEYEACVKAVEQGGNQAAWYYVDMLSAHMLETTYELQRHAERLHQLIRERDDYLKEVDRSLKEFYNKK